MTTPEQVAQYQADLERNEHEMEEELAKIIDANPEPARLLKRSRWTMFYSTANDQLYVTLGDPRPGTAFEMDEFWVIYDPETYELLGIEIPEFKGRLDRGLLDESWRQLFNRIQPNAEYRHTPRPVSPRERFAQEMAAALQDH